MRMNILNYNGPNQDIYTFNETGMVLFAFPTSEYETIPGVRQHAPVTGWNNLGLWKTDSNIIASGIPDWSGLCARSRGSPLYNSGDNAMAGLYGGRVEPIGNLWNAFRNGATAGSQAGNELNKISHWNNVLPPFIIISKKHFVACRHFIGNNNYTPQSFNVLNGDGTLITITGSFLASYQDKNLYHITAVANDTEIKDSHKIKIYQILNIDSTRNDWEAKTLRLWYQVNNGMFLTSTYSTWMDPDLGDGTIVTEEWWYALQASHTQHNPNGPYATWDFVINGDSGTPILATYKGETYVVGMMELLAQPKFCEPTTFSFLSNAVFNDSGIVLSLFDPFASRSQTKIKISETNYVVERPHKDGLKIIVNEYDYIVKPKPRGILLYKIAKKCILKAPSKLSISLRKTSTTKILKQSTII